MWSLPNAVAKYGVRIGSNGLITRNTHLLRQYNTSRPSYRILCVDVPEPGMDKSCIQEFTQRGHSVEHFHLRNSIASEDELQNLMTSVDAMVVSPTTKLPAVFPSNLKLVAVPSATIDSRNIDTIAAINAGVMLMQLDATQIQSDKFSIEAELGMTRLLQLIRKIPLGIHAVREASVNPSKTIQRDQFSGKELQGKKIGIIGLGNAGKNMTKLAKAMDMDVLGYDPHLSDEAALDMGVQLHSLDFLYAHCDIITFHAPLTAKTRGMFNDEALKLCKEGVLLVCVAEQSGYDGVLNADTVLHGLSSGKIAGIAMDLLATNDCQMEGTCIPPPSETWEQIINHENMLTTCHTKNLGGKHGQFSQDAGCRIIAENVCDALEGRNMKGVANGVFMYMTLIPEMQPYMRLGEQLGRFLPQLLPKGQDIRKVTITTKGGVAVDLTRPHAKAAIQSAIMKGLLLQTTKDNQSSKKINYLNATMVAMAEGIDVRQGDITDPKAIEIPDLTNSVSVCVDTKDGDKHQSLLLVGTLFGDDPRIVRINEHSNFPPFRPEGNLLVFQNVDKPGAMADILHTLSDAHINIANLGLSRQDSTPLALGILTTDDRPTEQTLQKLQSIPALESLHFIGV